MKKIFSILLVSALVITGTIGATGMSVSAAYPYGSSEMPTLVSPEYSETSDQYLPPLGALSEEDIQKINEELYGGDDLDDLFTGTRYTIVVTSGMTGYSWRGWKVTGGPGGSVSLGHSYSISNGWNATIQIGPEAISASVGYDVTYTSSMYASYTSNITAGMYGHIGYSDFYDSTLTNLDITARHYTLGILTGTETGTGNSWAWTRFVYAYGETLNSATLPPTPYY